MKIEIKNRTSNKIILCGEYESIRDCLEKNESADLTGADLRGAYLTGADLRGADLRGAYLTGAYLTGAYLRGAYLTGADYNGEKLSKEPIQIAGLKYFVLITKEQMKIGCELHKIEEWKKFEDKRIIQMGGKDALVLWNDNKKILFDLNKKHCGKAVDDGN